VHCVPKISLKFGITPLPSTKRLMGKPPSASISAVKDRKEFFLYLIL